MKEDERGRFMALSHWRKVNSLFLSTIFHFKLANYPCPLTFAAEIENRLISGLFSSEKLLLKAIYGKSW